MCTHVHTHIDSYAHTPLEDGTVLQVILSKYCLRRSGLLPVAPKRLCNKNPVFFTCTTFQSGPHFKMKRPPLSIAHIYKGSVGLSPGIKATVQEVEVIWAPRKGWKEESGGGNFTWRCPHSFLSPCSLKETFTVTLCSRWVQIRPGSSSLK